MELFFGYRVFIKEMQKEKSIIDEGVEVFVLNVDIEVVLRNVEDEVDYMVLKKVEEEEVVDQQEFTEEVIGRLEDEDLVNEDVIKVDDFRD